MRDLGTVAWAVAWVAVAATGTSLLLRASTRPVGVALLVAALAAALAVIGGATPPLAAAVAAGTAVVLSGVLLRYAALDRAGSRLPAGAGGARLVGATGIVEAAHRPGTARGSVRVLGDVWGVADDVADPLAAGQEVRVLAVVGTRLRVAPTARQAPTHQRPPTDERPRSQP